MAGNATGRKVPIPLGMLLASLFAAGCGGGGDLGVTPQKNYHQIVPIVPSPSSSSNSVMLSTSSLSLLGTGAANAQRFTASQNNYGGAFTVTTPAGGQPSSCSGIATVSPSLGAGPFTLTGVAAGACSFTVTGGNGQSASLTVVVTITTVGAPTPTPNPTPSPSPSSGLITYNASTACINHFSFTNNGISGNNGEFDTLGFNRSFWSAKQTRTLSPQASWPGLQASWGRHQYDTYFGDSSDGLGYDPFNVSVDPVSGVQALSILAGPMPSPIATSLTMMANDQWIVTSANAPFAVPAEGGSLTVNVANPNGAQNNWKVGIGYAGGAVTFIGTLTSGGATPSGNGTGGSNPWTISNVHIYSGIAGTTVTPGINDEGGFRAYNFPAYYSGALDLNLPIEYGFFVARLRLPPYLPALSPAFWTLQTGGVANPSTGLQRNEDDIMEMFGNTSGNVMNAGQIHWNTSPSQFWPTPTGVYSWPLSGDPSTAYHDYGMLLANGSTTFYLDGTPISSHAGGPDWTNGTADKELMLMFQVGAPGSWLDPNSQGPSNKWPQYLWSQWIRVYQPTASSC